MLQLFVCVPQALGVVGRTAETPTPTVPWEALSQVGESGRVLTRVLTPSKPLGTLGME